MPSPKKVVSPTPCIRVGPSGIHGLGAFATQALQAGDFIGFYEGRRYTTEQIAARNWDDRLTYLFTLSDGMTIDGGKGGNATRHLNHCCAPNCEAVEEYDAQERLVLRFQTLQAIEAGDELFIDYSLTADDSASADEFACHCGAPACRGTMLAPVEPSPSTA